METLEFNVDASANNIRIDRYLADQCPEHSRSYIQKLLKEEQVLVNGRVIKANYKTQSGDYIEFHIPDPEVLDILPENIPLDILYEDDYVLVVNKPKDMVVHPSAGHTSGTLVNAVMAHCGEHLSGINGVLRPGIVHRIDKDTTGALLICKDDVVHRDLAEQLKEHSIKRRYRAVVQGNLKEDEGTVNAPVGRHPTDRKKMAINHKNGKEAITNRSYTPDPCSYGKPRTSASRRYCIWFFQKSLSPSGPGIACNDSWFCSSDNGRISGVRSSFA